MRASSTTYKPHRHHFLRSFGYGNDNLEQQAQALFKSWFVDFEPFKSGRFVESELGMIPEGWRLGALKDIADITMGQSPSSESFNEMGNGTIFFQGRAEFGKRYPIPRLYTSQPVRYAKRNSILVSVRAPVGDINIALWDCAIGRGLSSLSSTEGNQSYLLYLLKNKKKEFDTYNGEGTVFGSINKTDLGNLKVIIPPQNWVKKFEIVVSELDNSIHNLSCENRNLVELRDALLPKLMSGELKIDKMNR